MAGGGNRAPVIIKRKKVVAGGGHHGGAWKVAYADFVTAMMAFFMLMWLLNATTEKQRKGIADYFNPTIAVNRVSGGGNGSLGGNSVFSENALPRMGIGATSQRPTSENRARGSQSDGADTSEAEMRQIEQMLMGLGGETTLERNDLRHIDIRLTDEGVTVELFDRPGAPLFLDEARPSDLYLRLMQAMARAAAAVTNPIAVEGHARAAAVVLRDDPTWRISHARAEATRAMLVANGTADTRFARTTAHADREPVFDNPMSERNNRIEIVFLRQ